MSALAGRRIVITRAPHQTGALERLLLARAALPLRYPCIEIGPPENTGPLDAALRDVVQNRFDWLVLTSANTAAVIAQRLHVMGIAPSALSAVKIAVVGPATAEAVGQALGLTISAMPGTFTSQALAQMLADAAGGHILLPQSALGGSDLTEALAAAGMDVTAVEAYRTTIGTGGVDLPALLAAGSVDAITFTSPSAVTNLLLRLEAEGASAASLAGVCLACIGTTTLAAVRGHGLEAAVVPAEFTLEALTDALEKYFESIEAGTV